MCAKCVLTTAVPRVTLDAEGVCNVCREYEAHKAEYDAYWKQEDDLRALLAASKKPESEYDVLLMYSGGKDSTYVLCRLMEMGQRVLALTFDNGYVPQQCFDNIKAVTGELHVDSAIVSVEKGKMDQVFAESLTKKKTVCSGCFRGLTARGTELAVEKKIPIIMTGLSRGQIYDTKVHQLVSQGVTNPEEIDEYLAQFREAYHEVDDKIAGLIEDKSLSDRAGFEATQFVDFFRYSAVKKHEIFELIQERVPFWRVPANVGGCSTNCMINDVGIQVHKEQTGYHNYAIPLSWDIRFGHMTRARALEEVDAEIDKSRVSSILVTIGLKPPSQART